MSCSSRGIVALVLLVCAVSMRSLAQNATAEVSGTVTDPSGAVIQNATVTLTSEDTHILSTNMSTGSGAYIFIDVPPGTYVLSVSARGFQNVQLSPFQLSVNQSFTQNVKLLVGNNSQTVEVSANSAELLQKSSSELGTVIQQDVVQDMPLNGRNFTELLTLTPGATPVSTAQGSGVSTQDAGMSGIPGSTLVKPSLHGQQNRSTLYYLDGVTNTDLRGPVYGVLPMLDATSQFKVQAHNEKVEYGGVVGGIVNMISRSGTNTMHGSAFWFLRNNFFDARDKFKDAFNAGPAPFHQNQFGGTLFFPIIRNRTFAALSYEGWRYSQPTQTFGYTPTKAEISGDFTNSINHIVNASTGKNYPLIFNPYSTVSIGGGNFSRTPFLCDASGNPVVPNGANIQASGTPCDKIPQQMFDPILSKLMSTFLRLPNYNGAAQPGQSATNYEEDRPRTDNNNEFQVKIDHQLTTKDNLWVRFTNMYVRDVAPVVGTIETSPSDYHGYDWGAGYTRVITQHIIYDAQAGILLKPYVFNTNEVPGGYQPIAALGVADAAHWGGLYASLGAPYTSLGNIGTAGNSIRKNPTWSASTSLSVIVGKHNSKIGLQFTNVQRVQQNTYQQFSFSGSQTNFPYSKSTTTSYGTFNSTNDPGQILASALLGVPNSYNGVLPTYSEDDFSLQMWSGYIQDEWRLTPKFTLESGLRYDYLNVPQILDGRISGQLDLTNQLYVVGGKQPPDCSVIEQNPCIPGGGFASVAHNTNIVFTGFNKSFLAPRSSEFEPRIGFAYAFRDSLVLRGGYGLFFDALPARSQYAQNELEAAYWPWATGFSGNTDAAGTTVTPFSSIEGHFATPVSPSSPWSIGGYYDDPHFKPPYSNQWNIELQQQFGKYTSLSLAYVGSSNGDLDYTGNANASTVAYPAGTSRAQQDATRPIPWMVSNLHWGASTGRSNYNALEARIMRQATRNFRTILSYTWSKSIDDSSGYFGAENGIGGGSAVQNYWDPRSNRSVSSYDIPQFISLAALYQIPLGHGQQYFDHGPLAYVLGDWQSNTILQARSGQPYNLVVNGDIANIEGSVNTLSGYGRPNLLPGANPIPQNQTAAEWFNPAAFTIPSGQFGNFSRNVMRGSQVCYMDFSMFKHIPIHDRINGEFRAEAFNLFNIQCLAPPGAGNSNQVVIGQTGAGAVNQIAYVPRQLQFGLRFTF